MPFQAEQGFVFKQLEHVCKRLKIQFMIINQICVNIKTVVIFIESQIHPKAKKTKFCSSFTSLNYVFTYISLHL